jgi:hypothetical protein
MGFLFLDDIFSDFPKKKKKKNTTISYMRLHKMNPSLYKKKYIYGMACNKPKFQRSFFALSAIHRRRVFACEAQRYTIYHPLSLTG